MIRRYSRIDTEEPTINLTPLIDVVFVILVVFILIAPLVEIDQITLAPGSEKTKETPLKARKAELAISIDKNGVIRINKREITQANLRPLLEAIKTQNRAEPPKLFCDKNAAFGVYQTVKNAVEDAGFETLDVIVSPQ